MYKCRKVYIQSHYIQSTCMLIIIHVCTKYNFVFCSLKPTVHFHYVINNVQCVPKCAIRYLSFAIERPIDMKASKLLNYFQGNGIFGWFLVCVNNVHIFVRSQKYLHVQYTRSLWYANFKNVPITDLYFRTCMLIHTGRGNYLNRF